MAVLEDDADPTYTHFAHREEFLKLLHRFLKLDLKRNPDPKEDEEEVRLVDDLGGILDYYLPLPGLLDPSLDEIVPPLMETLIDALNILNDHTPGLHINASRLQRLGKVINWVIKVRGYKAILPHFPSSIHNLPTLITLLSPPTSPTTSSSPSTPHHPLLSGQEAWEIRAVILLWLSLLLTVPFDLSALSTEPIPVNDLPSLYPSFDKGSLAILFPEPTSQISTQVTLLALPLLHSPGKEGTYAALVLARLYSRSDAVHHLQSFFNWAKAELEEGEREGEAHFVAALFDFLAVLPSLLAPTHLGRLEWFTIDVLLPHLRGGRTAASSGLVRKLAVKARGRWWIAKLGHRQRSGGSIGSSDVQGEDMPEGLEEELDDLMNGLSDKDTIVRYSCAKYLARISALLPPAFAEQIVLATIALFGGTEDEPVIATPFSVVIDPGGTASTGGTMGFGGAETTRGEARWHGCCLAIAEMSRRGLLVDSDAISQSVDWVLKALTFDLRRASHSIGANVRDAAAYLIWSLSRACSPSSLSPYSDDLATALICVACFDREVGVRRAASAASQEGVGRLGLYPEGIDVLGKTDFYSVSVRRTAFSTAAPAVARHEIYRNRMREHLHQITLRHWDVNMRTLGATAMKQLISLGSESDLQDSIDREIKEIPSLDSVNVHGALCALTEICSLLSDKDERRKTILHAISSIRPAALVSTQGAGIIQAACDLISASLSPISLDQPIHNDLIFHYLDLVMKRKESDCYEAAARIVGRLSELRQVDKEIDRLLQMIASPRAIPRQVAVLALGHVQYAESLSKLSSVMKALPYQGEESAKADVETRRYAVRSLSLIISQSTDQGLLVNPEQFQESCNVFQNALSDYSTDQRGDVGSWIRVAGLLALGKAIAIAATQTDPVDWLSQEQFEQAVGGMIKLGMEKLEPVRAATWRSWRLMKSVKANVHWKWDGREVWNFDVPDESDESFRYIELKAWYTSAMPLLQTDYRFAVISGLVNSIGSQVESVASVAFASLRKYLTEEKDTSNLVVRIMEDLQRILSGGVQQNRIFIPTTTTITKLITDTHIRRLVDVADCSKALSSILSVGCKGIPQYKSIERINVSMKLVISSISLSDPVRSKAISLIPLFLAHRFPRIRAMSAEYLYLTISEVLEDDMNEELECLLVETEWTDEQVGKQEAEEVVRLLKEEMGG